MGWLVGSLTSESLKAYEGQNEGRIHRKGSNNQKIGQMVPPRTLRSISQIPSDFTFGSMEDHFSSQCQSAGLFIQLSPAALPF